jgi:hypothetical protein
MHIIFDQVSCPLHLRRVARVICHLQAVDPLLFPPHGDQHGSYAGDGVSMRVEWVRTYSPA